MTSSASVLLQIQRKLAHTRPLSTPSSLIELRRTTGFSSLKAGRNPALRGLYGQFFLSSLIDRRRNNVACGLNYLGG